MTSLPTLTEIQSSPSGPSSPLSNALIILFEHSPILISKLEPQLSAQLKNNTKPLSSYNDLVDLSLAEISKWDITSQSEFISGHPRIGESKNLSKLSAKEQGAQGTGAATNNPPTPPEVLARLAHLNACYEARYPGLRYITFVNGRSRAAIAEEMEDVLEVGSHSLVADGEPDVGSVVPIEVGSEVWRKELERAVGDIGKIAKSRLGSLLTV